MNVDNITNGLQIVVLAVCVIGVVWKAAVAKNRAWTLLALFLGSWWMGDIYWAGCLFFLDEMPQVSWVSDLNWCASFVFLYLLLREVAPPAGKIRILPWLGPVFTTGMAVFFMQWGEILNNVVYALLMGLLLFSALRRLMDGEKSGARRFLSVLILVFCLLEYALWIASCFWEEEVWAEPYYWFDILLTACFPIFLPATKRAMNV